MREMWLPFLWVSSTGMGRQRIVGFAHIAIEIPGENTSNEWLEPVSKEEYGKLK